MRKWLLLLALCLATASAGESDATPCPPKPLYGITYAPLALNLDTICLPVDQVYKDMEIIAKLAHSVRIYNIGVCYDNAVAILESAKKYGMTVLLGLWLQEGDPSVFEEEFRVLPKVMKAYGDIIEAVIVGNEPLFIELLKLKRVKDAFYKVKHYLRANGYDHPVSVAEVWPMLESPFGLQFVKGLDFIAMNMQPYWEGFYAVCPSDKPDCVGAGEYIHLKAQGLANYFDKPLVITEAGWPTEGEPCCSGQRDHAQRGFKAVPSIPNASAFVKDLVHHAKKRKVMYYVHTSFDEIWKKIWDPCDECKGRQVSKHSNDECNGCVVDYNWGIYTGERGHKAGYKLPPPVPQCTYSQFPEIRARKDVSRITGAKP